MNKIKLQKREKVSVVKKHWVRLTRVCNNKCIFCLDKEPQDGSILTLRQIQKDFAKGFRMGCRQVVLSGGEATIHPDFFKIVALARKMGYKKIQVISNGRMFAYGNFLQLAIKAGIDEITFSFHGHNAVLHDKQTGVAGSFSQALVGLINALKQQKLIVSVDIVINKKNYKKLFDIINFFIALGVYEFDLLQVIPFGRAWDNRRKIFYNIKRAMPHLKKAFELSKNKDLFIWTNRFPVKYLEGYEELIQNPKKIIDEVQGRQELINNYLKTGEMLNCYPLRCTFCFLKDFCQNLRQFKTTGRLESKIPPLCLSAKKERNKILFWDKKTDINNFVDFYISYRYFVKSERCSICEKNKQCQGAHINMIRRNGFKILRPIKR